MNELYDKVLEDAGSKFRDSVKQDVQDGEFNWDRLIELLLIEDSALQDVFSSNTLQLADLYNNARTLHQSYVDLSAKNQEGEG